ncbi:hypothetical protein INR49_027726, partial [Caranx melampygus]
MVSENICLPQKVSAPSCHLNSRGESTVTPSAWSDQPPPHPSATGSLRALHSGGIYKDGGRDSCIKSTCRFGKL